MERKVVCSIDGLVEAMVYGDEAAVDDAMEQLVECGASAVPAMISVLRSPVPSHRNRAALVLREIADDSAVSALIEAIERPENRHHTGTLIYALQTMDCRKQFWTLFRLVLEGDFEERCMAHVILEDQALEVTPADLERAKNQLHAVVPNELGPRFPAAIRELLDEIERRSLRGDAQMDQWDGLVASLIKEYAARGVRASTGDRNVG